MGTQKGLRIGMMFGLIIACLAGAAVARADFKDLLRRIPGEANTLVVVDVEKVLNSPLAQREGWPQAQLDAYAAKPMVVPPGATRVVFAAQLEPGTLRSRWEVSVMDLNEAPSIEAIARAEGGYLEKLADKPAVWSPIDAYFVQLDPKVLGVVTPANRQIAARWVRQKQTVAGAFAATYLTLATSALDRGAEVVLAMDLEDVTSMAKIQRRLREDPPQCLADRKVDTKALSAVLASVKGLMLTVDVGEEATVKGEIEFGVEAAPLGDLAKPLLLELLGNAGASLPDLESWEFSVRGPKILAAGTVSPEGLRRIFSVVNPPAPLEVASAPAGTEAAPARPTEKQPPEKEPTPDASKAALVTNSQKYYKAVTEIVDKLQSKIGTGSKAASLADSATWMKRDARRIDRLPILNVDPELLAWGGTVSARLLEAAQVLSVGQLDTLARTTGIENASGWSDYDYDGNYTGQATAASDGVRRQRQQAAMEEKARAHDSAAKIFKDLAGARQKVRADMTQRYGVEF